MSRAFIGVGSNVEPERNIRAALRLLSGLVRVAGISTFYRTPAEGHPGQPDYTNGVVSIETHLPPEPLKFTVLRAIEQTLGRQRTADREAPRPIDLDLLLYGSLQLSRPGMRLPSDDVERRAFVAIPLAEIAPELRVPGKDVSISTIAARYSRASMHPLVAFTGDLRRGCARGPPA